MMKSLIRAVARPVVAEAPDRKVVEEIIGRYTGILPSGVRLGSAERVGYLKTLNALQRQARMTLREAAEAIEIADVRVANPDAVLVVPSITERRNGALTRAA